MSLASNMPEAATPAGRRRGTRGKLWLAALVLALVALRAGMLLYDHSLHSLDGAMQTWFALDNFSRGEALGSGFQSYLGVTMVLGLLPSFVLLGGTLFASTLSAYAAVIAGAFASAYAIAWMIRWIRPQQRWIAAILLVFGFYYLGSWAAQALGLAYPLALDPGVSLRPVRGLLPVLALPFFVVLVRRVIGTGSARPAFALGLICGVGLLWSNDAGIPLVIAVTAGLALALIGRTRLMVHSVLGHVLGTVTAAAGILLAVTHGDPSGWLQYNFRDVAGDQFWYFAPWGVDTRVLGLTDLPKILMGGDQLSTLGLVLLTICVVVAAIRRMRRRGSPTRDAAFVMVGASTLGTALIPQVGGHIEGVYNYVTFMLGICAPVIVFQRSALRWSKAFWRKLPAIASVIAAGLAAVIMLTAETARLGTIVSASERDIYDPALGFNVDEAKAVDLAAMRWLVEDWDKRKLPNDRRLLSVYTSVLDIGADTHSPAPVGSLIHALGAKNRADYTALVADSQVTAVTTIRPSYSGWEGWLLRANWPFFRALQEHYRPIAANDQQVLWVPAEDAARPVAAATCEVIRVSDNALRLKVTAQTAGLASIAVERGPPFATGRSAMLTATETSPFTKRADPNSWTDFPRYGIANTAKIALVVPVEPGTRSTLLLEVIDGSAIGTAQCSAKVYPAVEYASLPSLPDGIARYVAGGTR